MWPKIIFFTQKKSSTSSEFHFLLNSSITWRKIKTEFSYRLNNLKLMFSLLISRFSICVNDGIMKSHDKLSVFIETTCNLIILDSRSLSLTDRFEILYSNNNNWLKSSAKRIACVFYLFYYLHYTVSRSPTFHQHTHPSKISKVNNWWRMLERLNSVPFSNI